MILYNNAVGKLVEGRIIFPATAEEIADAGRFMAAVEKKYAGSHVNLIDLRQAGVGTQQFVEASVERLHHHDCPPVRAAIVLEEGVIQRIQLKRIVRAAKESEDRARLVSTVADALVWLKPVLTAVEYDRARQFLEEGTAKDAKAAAVP